MSFELRRTYRFEAAHRLPKVDPGHPCHNLHGHSYEVGVEIAGELDPRLGWVSDFAEIDALLNPLLDRLDHTCLNDTPGLENPTSEIVARWIWERIEPDLSGLRAVSVSETTSSHAIYRGDA